MKRENRTSEFLYGVNPVFEAVRAHKRRFFAAYVQENSKNKRLKKLLQLLENASIPVHTISKIKLRQMTGSPDHQGVALHTSLYPYVALDTMTDATRLLLCDNLEDPHNLGAILRSAEIFGIQHVLLPTKGVPGIYPSVVKTSAGASEHLSISRESSVSKYIHWAQENALSIYALDAKGNLPLPEFKVETKQKVLLVVGGEDRGVGQFILNHADGILSIPQQGRVNSLNASVAAALAMYALTQQSP